MCETKILPKVKTHMRTEKNTNMLKIELIEERESGMFRHENTTETVLRCRKPICYLSGQKHLSKTVAVR